MGQGGSGRTCALGRGPGALFRSCLEALRGVGDIGWQGGFLGVQKIQCGRAGRSEAGVRGDWGAHARAKLRGSGLCQALGRRHRAPGALQACDENRSKDPASGGCSSPPLGLGRVRRLLLPRPLTDKRGESHHIYTCRSL